MNAPKVDVRAVLRDAIRYEKKSGGSEEWIAELSAARAAVVELIEAISAFRGKRGAFMALGAKDDRTVRLWAALASIGGQP